MVLTQPEPSYRAQVRPLRASSLPTPSACAVLALDADDESVRPTSHVALYYCPEDAESDSGRWMGCQAPSTQVCQCDVHHLGQKNGPEKTNVKGRARDLIREIQHGLVSSGVTGAAGREGLRGLGVAQVYVLQSQHFMVRCPGPRLVRWKQDQSSPDPSHLIEL